MSHIFFRHIIINLFFLLLMGGVFGQTIKGVVSGKPNQPLDGATVRIEFQNRATSTNAQGEFEFLNVSEGTFDINVTYIGFISQTISVTLNKGDTKTVNFSLKTETAQLEEVSIFGINNKQRFEKKLNAQYFQRTQAIEIKDVFSDLPSVALGGGAPNAQRIYVRGIESSNLNVTIDGAQQGRNLFIHRGNAGSIDPGLLKTVTITTGVDASQPSGTLSGSIAYETIDAQDLLYNYGKVGGNVQTGFQGAANCYNLRATIGTKLSDYSGLLAYVSYTDRDDYRDGENQIIPNTASEDQNYLLKFSLLNYNNHELKVSTAYNRNSGSFIQGGPGSDFGTPSDTIPAVDQILDRQTYTLNHIYSPKSPLVDIHTNVHYNESNLKTENDSLSIDATSNLFGASIKNNFGIDIGKLKNIISLGVDYEKEDAESMAYSSLGGGQQTNTSTVFGLFAQGLSEFSIFSLIYGIRLVDYKSEFQIVSLDDSDILPSVGLIARPIENLELSANYGESVRASGLLPIQALANIFEGTDINGGRPLEPETSQTFEVGVSYVKEAVFGKDRLSVSAQVFKTQLDNLIERVDVGRTPIGGIRNDSLGVISKGFEASLGWQTKKLQINLGFVLVDMEDEDGNLIPVNRRKAAPTGNRFNWSTLWQATSELQFGYSLNSVGDLDEVYEDVRPGYTLHNIQVNWTPRAIRGLRASLAVNNLFNKGYIEQTSLAFFQSIIPEPGRDIRISLSYNF